MENNFKNLKDKITKETFDSIISGTKSKDFKKFVTEVKKSQILKEQLDVYQLVENQKFDTKEDALFIFERAMRQFEKYSVEEVTLANKNIVESFGGIFDGNDNVFKTIVNIYAKGSDSDNLSATVKGMHVIAESMVTDKSLPIEPEASHKNPTKKEIKRATEILNEKFSFLDDTEKKIFKSFITKNESQKEGIYNDLLKENINLVKRKLYESEEDGLEEKLSKIKLKLTEDRYTSKKDITDFVKLVNLNKTLK